MEEVPFKGVAKFYKSFKADPSNTDDFMQSCFTFGRLIEKFSKYSTSSVPKLVSIK